MAAASDRPHGSFAAGARSDDPGFCELYKEYLDQDPAACAILGSRRVRNTRISGEFSLFDKVMRDESNKYKERLEGLECLGNEWLELLRFKQAYLVAISNDMNFSLTSANEDICIKAASHALKYLSVYPLAQVLLFARKKFDAMLAYLESMPPKRTIDMTEMSRLLYVCEAGWFSVKPKSLESIGRSNTPPLPVLVDVSAKEETSDTISGTPRPGYNGFILNSGAYHSATTKAKGNLANKDILMLSRADNGDTSSELTSSTLTGGNHQRGTDSATDHKPIVILDTAAGVNVTGDEAVFYGCMPIPEGFDLIAANGNIMTSNWCGYVIHERFEVSCVYFNADLGPRTVISGPELDLLGYGYTCVRGKCSVWDVETYQIVGEGRLIDNSKYLLDHLKIPFTRDPVPLPEGPMAVGPGGPLQEGPLQDGALQERPLHEGPSFMSSAWKAGCTVLRSFAGSLLKRSQASAQTR